MIYEQLLKDFEEALTTHVLYQHKFANRQASLNSADAQWHENISDSFNTWLPITTVKILVFLQIPLDGLKLRDISGVGGRTFQGLNVNFTVQHLQQNKDLWLKHIERFRDDEVLPALVADVQYHRFQIVRSLNNLTL